MPENGNIEKLAKIVSQDIFSWLKWDQRPVMDVDWACELEHHGKKTHPSDTVFSYIHPYTGDRIYLNTDLKSYQKKSINATSVRKALQSLALSVECANVSADWQDKFHIDDEYTHTVVGLLFIYNHDNEFDRVFYDLLNAVDRKNLAIANGNALYVLGPAKIRFLLSVVNDMRRLKADDTLPNKSDFTFYYPDLVLSKRHCGEWGQPATIEMLTGPWIIIKHKAVESTEEGFLIYYSKQGETIEEFVYFLDTLSHYQLLLSNYPIRLRFVDACDDATLNFIKAKEQYLKTWGPDHGREQQLDRINPESVSTIVTKFNPLEVGMRDA
ncbi:hypothetical protein [Marinagarivorans algicola]|uniref:hypothetical protein n=1 Tax=Marinagarivorans algicola TaxID=1513270 RepID=UPI0006B8EAC2|nr:hypothetical protein [Marinagarivorans algicola]